MGRQVSGSSIGIIGYGSIGSYLAHLAQALGMTVLVADPFATVEDPNIAMCRSTKLLRNSDYVVCLVVANKDTENLIGAARLELMQPHACFMGPFHEVNWSTRSRSPLRSRQPHRRRRDRCRPPPRPDADGSWRAAETVIATRHRRRWVIEAQVSKPWGRSWRILKVKARALVGARIR